MKAQTQLASKSNSFQLKVIAAIALGAAAIAGCGGGGIGDPPFNAQGQYVGRISGYDISNQPVTGNITMFVGSNGTGTLVVYDADNQLTASLNGTVNGNSGEFTDFTGHVRFLAQFNQTSYNGSPLIPTASGSWQNTFNGSYGTWSTQLPVVGPALDATQSPMSLFQLGENAPTNQQLILCIVENFIPANGLYGCNTPNGRSFVVKIEPALNSNGVPLLDYLGHQMKIVSCRRLGTGFICVANWTGPSILISQMWQPPSGGGGSTGGTTGGGGL